MLHRFVAVAVAVAIGFLLGISAARADLIQVTVKFIDIKEQTIVIVADKKNGIPNPDIAIRVQKNTRIEEMKDDRAIPIGLKDLRPGDVVMIQDNSSGVVLIRRIRTVKKTD